MIFVVEDEPVLLRSLVEYLRQTTHQVEGFGDAESALAAAKESPPDVLVTDLQLPGMDGLALAAELGALDPGMVRILMTAHSSVASAVKAMRQGCYEYLEKPLDLHKLARLIDRAQDERRASRELGWLRETTAVPAAGEVLLGESAAMQAVRRQLDALAGLGGSLPPILLTGETGVGKGLVARTIHARCHGREAPWIELNCAAIPENLIEGELFGFEKSAFTDAKQSKPGLFEAASGGVIFLDEIGELALQVQAKLLKVVESRAVRRLGAVRDRPVSATIVAASNVELRDAIAAGRFRADLFHRIAAFSIEVPPLRERGDDAVLLASRFVVEAGQRYRKAVRELSPDAATHIRSGRWPGNVRELRFAIERAVILASPDATELSADHVLPDAPSAAAPPASARIGGRANQVAVELPPEGIAFDELEKAILRAALARAQGNVVQAARLLQLKRDAMRYRVRKFGLESDENEGDGSKDPVGGKTH